MFNVKRNGASVEITDIPQSIPFSVFKDIADKTGATETLVAYVKDKDCYEVVIRHDSVDMAGAAAWLALEAREPEADERFRLPKYAIYAAQDTLSKLIIKLDMIEEEPAKKLALVVKKAFTELYR